jgi:hypothetical protein
MAELIGVAVRRKVSSRECSSRCSRSSADDRALSCVSATVKQGCKNDDVLTR